MAIQTNLKSLKPARERFKREIKLLSGGFSMKDIIPGGLITIYPWDQSIDDWVIKNIKKVQMATLPYEITKKLVGLESIEALPAGDVNTILLVAKAAARDCKVTYKATCPACNHVEVISLTIPDQLERIGEKGPDYPGWDEFTLPACQDTVRVRPLLVRDERALLDHPDNDAIPRSVARAITHLVSVNGGPPDSPEEAATWFKALQPSDFDFYVETTAKLEPHLGTDLKHKCDKCGTEFMHNLSLDAEFFR